MWFASFLRAILGNVSHLSKSNCLTSTRLEVYGSIWSLGKVRERTASSACIWSSERLRLTLPSVKALMTIPNAESDLLIFFASSSVWPVAPVLPT